MPWSYRTCHEPRAGISELSCNLQIPFETTHWAAANAQVIKKSGTPEWIRATDLLLRRQEPAEKKHFPKKPNNCSVSLNVPSYQRVRGLLGTGASNRGQAFYARGGHKMGTVPWGEPFR